MTILRIRPSGTFSLLPLTLLVDRRLITNQREVSLQSPVLV